MIDPVSFRCLGTSGAHKDLELCIGSYRHIADSYYFRVDDAPTSPSTLESRLALLLQQWLCLIDSLEQHTTTYLPFDFSDQCTAWLRVALKQHGEVLVEVGWSRIEGWSFYPSDVMSTARQVTDFRPIAGACVTTTIEVLRTAINRDHDAIMAKDSDSDHPLLLKLDSSRYGNAFG